MHNDDGAILESIQIAGLNRLRAETGTRRRMRRMRPPDFTRVRAAKAGAQEMSPTS